MSFTSMLQAAGRDADTAKYEQVYDGTVTLSSLGVSLPPDVRVLEMTAPFPKLSVDVLVEALTVEGFICEGHDDATREVWRLWQAANLDTLSKLSMTESCVRGTSYLTVTRMEDGSLRVQGLSPDNATVEWDAAGRVTEGIWRFQRGDTRNAIYYLPGETYLMEFRYGKWVTTGHVSTGAPVPSIIPVPNRLRLNTPRGMSDLDDLVTLTDAASRSLTNLQIAQELLAMPIRGVFGDGMTTAFNADKGAGAGLSAKRKIDAYMGGLVLGPKGTELKQLPGADLTQIIRVIELYARMISAVTGIPPSMLGLSTDNPASAEAMRAAKERLITRAETKQQMFGDAFEDLARVMLAMSGKPTAGLESLECVWRDPATPSVASKAANALQAHAQGVISSETAREFLALTPEQRKRESAREPFVFDMDETYRDTPPEREPEATR